MMKIHKRPIAAVLNYNANKMWLDYQNEFNPPLRYWLEYDQVFAENRVSLFFAIMTFVSISFKDFLKRFR